MYDRIILTDRFRSLVRLALFFCFYFWYFCGSSLAAYQSVDEEKIGSYLKVDSFYVKLTGFRQNSVYTGHCIPSGWRWVNYYNVVGLMGSSSGSNCYQVQKDYWCEIIPEHLYNEAASFARDDDADGLKNGFDPCPNATDKNYTVYRTKNKCTGSYYFFQITGECGQTKTYHSPEYSNIGQAYNAAKNATSECFNAVRDSDRVNMTPSQLMGFWDSLGANATGSAEMPSTDISSPDPTGGNNTSTVPPKETDASDPDNQKILNQLERLKVGIEDAVYTSNEKVRSQVEISGNALLAGIRGLGGSDWGVASAINNAAANSRADSEALGAKLDTIAAKIGTPQNATYGGLSKSEMDDALQLDRQETFKVEPNVFDSIETSQQSLIDKVTSRATELKNKVTGLIPDFSVSASSPSSCVPSSSTSLAGYSVTLPEICLTRWESYFVMLGNLLYAAACIGCIFSIFGFRG